MMIRLNITPKLTLIFVFFAALLLAIVSILTYTKGSSALESAAVAELFSTAIEKQAALNAWVTETGIYSIALSTSPYLREMVSDFLSARTTGSQTEIQAVHDRLVAELKVWVGENRDFQDWMILDPQSGEIIASTDPGDEGKFRENQPYFINGKSGPFLQNLYFVSSSQATLMTVSAPIRSKNEILLGVLAGNLDLKKISEIVSRRTNLRQSDDVFLVNKSELFVTQPRFISDPAILQRGIHTEAVKRCLMAHNGIITAPDYRGVSALIVYRWLSDRQLCLIVKMDQAEALAPVLALRNNILIISILALLVASLLAYLLARTITRPVYQLVKAAQEIGAGKLDTPIEIRTGDEIDQLAMAFTQMAEDLQNTLVSRDDLFKESSVRRETEEALRETNDYLENLFNYANAPIIVWDTQFKITRFNHAFETLTGRNIDEVLGKPLAILFPPAQIEASMKLIRKTLTGERWEVVEIHIQHVDGSILTVLWNSATIFSPNSKAPIATIAQGQDITKRKRAEDLLSKRLELLGFATSHSLDELLQKTLDDVGELTGSPIGFYHFVDSDQQNLSLQAWSTSTIREFCKADGKGLHYPISQAGIWADCVYTKMPVIHNDYATETGRKGLPEGHAAVIRELIVPILRANKIVAILGIGNKPIDYTQDDIEIVAYFADFAWESAERKRADEILKSYSGHLQIEVEQRTRELRETQEKLVRQERLATLGQLAGSVSHELRNPLGVISNAVYFLKMAQPDASDKVKEYLDIVEKEIRISDKIVTDLLDFTRIKSVDREPIAVSELIMQALDRYPVSPLIEVTLDLPADLPLVYADPHHVVQVLGNLTVNACQAMVSISSKRKDDSERKSAGGKLSFSAVVQNDYICIKIHDNGTGISPENMKKLFEPLFTTKVKGIGLGLAVSKKLIEANDGRIEVQSESGKGSTFSLFLPIEKEEK